MPKCHERQKRDAALNSQFRQILQTFYLDQFDPVRKMDQLLLFFILQGCLPMLLDKRRIAGSALSRNLTHDCSNSSFFFHRSAPMLLSVLLSLPGHGYGRYSSDVLSCSTISSRWVTSGCFSAIVDMTTTPCVAAQ